FVHLRHRHYEDTLLESCLDLVEIDVVRQRDRALDRAEPALREDIVLGLLLLLLLLLLLRLLLALEGEHAVADFELDVALVHSGQLGRELIDLVLLDYIDGGSTAPATGEQPEGLEVDSCAAECRAPRALVELFEYP